jgi:hypothetical protein
MQVEGGVASIVREDELPLNSVEIEDDVLLTKPRL